MITRHHMISLLQMIESLKEQIEQTTRDKDNMVKQYEEVSIILLVPMVT